MDLAAEFSRACGAPTFPTLLETSGDLARLLEWSRFPGEVVFIAFGVVPITIAAVRAWLGCRRVALLAAPISA